MVSKRIKYIAGSSVFIGVFLLSQACQVIPENERFIPLKTATNARTSLLVDFSAWQCINCPAAAEEAHALLQLYGNQLIVIEAHPASNGLTKPPTQHPEYDYTCPAADSLYARMGGTNVTPLPQGVINLSQTSNGGYFASPSEWGALIYSAQQTYDSVDIQLNRITAEQIEYKLTNWTPRDAHCTLYMYLTEDSIRSAQYLPDSHTTDYIRNHLLRDAILPHAGIAVTINAFSEHTDTVAYTLPDHVVPEHAHIIAAIYCNGQVIQAQQTDATAK